LKTIPTARVLIALKSPEVTGPAIIYGAPDYGPFEQSRNAAESRGVNPLVRACTSGHGYPPLKASGEEALGLAKLLKENRIVFEKPLLGAAASKAAIRGIEVAPRLLHLATHGCAADASFASDPLRRVELAFANANRNDVSPDDNGVLSGIDITQLRLNGTGLVTLSACDTGNGSVENGEGVMSLAHAFRLAGARKVLMTLGNVDDEKAKEFILSFYSHWLSKKPEDISGALRETKLQWISKGESIRTWSTFVLVENQL
jgi:CHAT domain-containing protein